jgi:hypothetical protein
MRDSDALAAVRDLERLGFVSITSPLGLGARVGLTAAGRAAAQLEREAAA